MLRAAFALCLALAAPPAYAQATYGTFYGYAPPCLPGASQSGGQCIGTVAPAVPPQPTVTTPTGTIATGTPAITGTGETGDTLTVSIDGVAQGSVTVASGAWSLTPAMLTNAAHTVTAAQVNSAGISSPVSAPLSFTVSVSVAAGTPYYFSAAGVDANDCKSAATSCTIAKISTIHYARDDSILCHAGDSLTGQIALDWTPSTGNVVTATDHPLVVDVYGGSAPCSITASGTASDSAAAIRLVSPNGFKLRNVKVTGNGGGIPRGFSIENPATVLAPGGVDIGNIETIGFWDGNSANFGAHVFLAGYPGAGINTVLVHDWKCHGATGVTSLDDACLNGYGNGINLQSVEVYNLAGWNIGGHPGVVNGAGGNGVECNGVVSCYIHNFVIHDIAANMSNCGGPYGAWAANTTWYHFAKAEIYNVHSTVGGGCDRGGFDGDNNSVNGLIEHAFVHDTDGPCVLDFEAGDGGNHHIIGDDVICANTGVQGYSALHMQGAHSNSSVLWANSTIVTTGSEQGIGTSQSSGCPTLSVVNNAVYAQGTGRLVHLDWIGGGDVHSNGVIKDFYCPGLSFSNNGYYSSSPSWQLEGWFNVDTQQWLSGEYPTTLAGWQTFIHGEAQGILADPLFVGPLTAGAHCTDETTATQGYAPPCPAGYQLQTTSTYRGAGANPWALSVSASNYWNTPQFNIGAY